MTESTLESLVKADSAQSLSSMEMEPKNLRPVPVIGVDKSADKDYFARNAFEKSLCFDPVPVVFVVLCPEVSVLSHHDDALRDMAIVASTIHPEVRAIISASLSARGRIRHQDSLPEEFDEPSSPVSEMCDADYELAPDLERRLHTEIDTWWGESSQRHYPLKTIPQAWKAYLDELNDFIRRDDGTGLEAFFQAIADSGLILLWNLFVGRPCFRIGNGYMRWQPGVPVTIGGGTHGGRTRYVLCPLHGERSASCVHVVGWSFRFWHCFGCGSEMTHWGLVKHLTGFGERDAIDLTRRLVGFRRPPWPLPADRRNPAAIVARHLTREPVVALLPRPPMPWANDEVSWPSDGMPF